MWYLLFEIAVFLLLAALLGLLIGWLIWGSAFGGAGAARDAEADWSSRLARLEADYNARLLQAEAGSAKLRAEIHALKAAPAPQAAGPDPAAMQRLASIEADLKSRLLAAEALAAERAQALDQSRQSLLTADADWRARLGALEGEREALRGEIQSLAARTPAPAADPDLAKRLAAAEAELQGQAGIIEGLRHSLEAAEAEAARVSAALSEERRRTSQIEMPLPAAAPADDGKLAALQSQYAELAGELDGLGRALSTERAKTAALEQALASAEAERGGIAAELQALRAVAAPAGGVPEDEHARVKAALDDCRSQSALSILDRDAEIAALRDRLAAFEAQAANGLPLRDRPDDLKEIAGIGPVLEKALAGLGIVTFKDVATLTPERLAEVQKRMGNSFGTRIVRERWQEQARTLHTRKYGEEP